MTQQFQAATDPVIRILVADGSRIHTQLLAEALRRDPQFLAISFEFDSKNLLPAIRNHQPDVLLLSSTLDGHAGRGFETLRQLRSAAPQLRTVILLESSTDEAVLSAFRAGARGVLSKSEPVDILNRCIRCVCEGQVWANSRQLTVAIEALSAAPVLRAENSPGISALSKRELQVVRSLAEGLTNREIAGRLGLSQHTVKNYLFRVFDKLGVSSRVELLFMTLGETRSLASALPQECGTAEEEFRKLQQASEAGLPVTQLAIAQMYLYLQKEPQDLVQAYAWYLLASDRASQTCQQILREMTPAQVAEAEQQARAWQNRLRESSVRHENPAHNLSGNAASASALSPKTKRAHSH